MWSGGFWGTHREDQWRRRKEREQERESQIRRQEQQVRNRIQDHYKRDLIAKDNVLQLTQNLLSVSRNREENSESIEAQKDEEAPPVAKKQRVENETDDSGSDAKCKVDPIQENLLCLSYAMYDTLYGASNFNPQSFCDFLIKSGARSLAEEIALAAIEQTCGDAEIVDYVLACLVPDSLDSENLVQCVKETLQDDSQLGMKKDEGKQVLLNWQAKHGNKEGAFQSALKIADESARVKACLLFLEGKESRRQQLQTSSPCVISPTILKVFADTEWPDFLASVELPEKVWRWDPGCQVMLSYAARSMSPEAGKRVGANVLELAIRGCDRSLTTEAYLASPSSVRNERQARDQIVALRKKSTKQMNDFISKAGQITAPQEIKGYLGSLPLDPSESLAKVVQEATKVSPSTCTTNHRDLVVAYKCSRCRESFGKAAQAIGFLVGLRQHSTTKTHPRFRAIGLDGNVQSVLQATNLYDAGVNAILTDLSTECMESLQKTKVKSAK